MLKGIYSPVRNIGKVSLCSFSRIGSVHRVVVNKLSTVADHISRTRNIGISAHIDSGKTTLTERILFYTGNCQFFQNWSNVLVFDVL